MESEEIEQQITRAGSRDGLKPSRLLSLLSLNYMGSLNTLDRQDIFPLGSSTSSILPSNSFAGSSSNLVLQLCMNNGDLFSAAPLL